MSGPNLILIRGRHCTPDDVARRATSLGEGHSATTLQTRHVTLADALSDPSQLDAGGVAWIVAGQADEDHLFELVGLLQDRHIPALLTRDHRHEPSGTISHDGVVTCPPDTPPAVVAAMLGCLRSQVPVLRNVRNELSMLRRHQGGLADQIGRIDEELRLAAQLQREFLPKSLASIGEVDFRVLFRPAGYVSGDIYDVLRLDEQHIGFFLADAVGHGVPAALLTMYIKRSLTTKRIDADAPRGYALVQPGEALAKLNQDMLESQSTQVRFATACYGIINCRTLEVCIARAGHPFPILLRACGETEQLQPEGGLLGVFEQEIYEQVTLQLDPGDRLLLYSDGFEMAFPGEDRPAANAAHRTGKRVATTQYEQEFEKLREGSLDDGLGRLQDKLDTQTGSLNQRDDLTMLCLGVGHTAAKAPSVETAVAAAA